MLVRCAAVEQDLGVSEVFCRFVLWSSLQKSDLRNFSLVDFELVVGTYSLTSRLSFISHSPLFKTR